MEEKKPCTFNEQWIESLLLSSLQIPMQTTESGLQYKDIVVGDGEVPIVGFQVLYCVSEIGCLHDGSSWECHSRPFPHPLIWENGLFIFFQTERNLLFQGPWEWSTRTPPHMG